MQRRILEVDWILFGTRAPFRDATVIFISPPGIFPTLAYRFKVHFGFFKHFMIAFHPPPRQPAYPPAAPQIKTATNAMSTMGRSTANFVLNVDPTSCFKISLSSHQC
jgi:hypothetical protein